MQNAIDETAALAADHGLCPLVIERSSRRTAVPYFQLFRRICAGLKATRFLPRPSHPPGNSSLLVITRPISATPAPPGNSHVLQDAFCVPDSHPFWRNAASAVSAQKMH